LASSAGAVGDCAGTPAFVEQRREEFAEFYREFIRTLIRFLLWQGASLWDAVEVAQETMQKAFNTWARIDNPQAWCRRDGSQMAMNSWESLPKVAHYCALRVLRLSPGRKDRRYCGCYRICRPVSDR
jgi:hypothetical protein